jgi:hypothetical protein
MILKEELMRNLLLVLALAVPSVAGAQVRYIRPVRVMVAPPPLKYEAPPPAPSPRHQWIAGYWASRGGANVWVGGHWAVPPAPSFVWEPARWDNSGGAWTFCEGHWRANEAPDPQQVYVPPPPPVQPVAVEVAPPAPPEEVRPQQPFDGAVWIPGFWHWQEGRHVWVAGRWSPQPAGYRWQEQRWEHRKDGKWQEHWGHWDHREHDRDDDQDRR